MRETKTGAWFALTRWRYEDRLPLKDFSREEFLLGLYFALLGFLCGRVQSSNMPHLHNKNEGILVFCLIITKYSSVPINMFTTGALSEERVCNL